MAIKIRPRVLKDAASFRLCWDTVAKERRFFTENKAPPLSAVRAQLRKNAREKVCALVAVDGKRVVGTVAVYPWSSPLLSHNGGLGMSVLPEYRRMGLGTKLMAGVLKMCRGKFTSLTVNVLGKNRPGRKFLKKMGFEPRGALMKKAVKMPYGLDDLLIMQKHLRRA